MRTPMQGTGLRAQGSVPPPARVSSTIAGTAAIAGVFIALIASTANAETVKLTAEGAASRAAEVSHVAAAALDRARAATESVNAADAARLPLIAGTATLAQRSSVPEFALPFALPGQEGNGSPWIWPRRLLEQTAASPVADRWRWSVWCLTSADIRLDRFAVGPSRYRQGIRKCFL